MSRKGRTLGKRKRRGGGKNLGPQDADVKRHAPYTKVLKKKKKKKRKRFWTTWKTKQKDCRTQINFDGKPLASHAKTRLGGKHKNPAA